MRTVGEQVLGFLCASALAGCFSNMPPDPRPGTEEPGGGSSSGTGVSPGCTGGGGSAPMNCEASGSVAGMGEELTGGRSLPGGSGGDHDSCSSLPACGGDMTGRWTVASSCLEVSGVLDVSALGLGCASAAITGSRRIAGTFVANADGTYEDRTTTSGQDQIQLAAACLDVAGTRVTPQRFASALRNYGYDSVTCTVAADGGFLCDAAFAQASGIGVLSLQPLVDGAFTTSEGVLTLVDGANDPTSYQYCALNGQVVLLPITTPATLRGTIVLTAPNPG